ncbi:SRPBCC domain-containing protein [Marinilongibacter aquaticus]|uniref:SRPBCC family protein n=1 Tax=Marinilongibacter aquaticus TaxID=2975157 RepID=UPI0021BD0077|nr:SRPBCC domain-containing protein [Marinilongibacter aquaticus]UBM60198.1 SRPBCC domain-containing protein [Marinilongibacter aquaticus]
MKNNLLFDFTADKNTHTVFMKREFDAELNLVWDAFTKQEILDQWGAPAPWKARTKYMDFKVGGRRLYAMVGPEGQEFWSVQDFTVISPKTNLQYISGFTDADENINPEFYGSENNLDFSEADGITTVRIRIQYKTLAVLEMMIERGFREGSAMTFENLQNLLNSIPEK